MLNDKLNAPNALLSFCRAARSREAPMLNDTLKLLITSMLVLCFGLSSAGAEGTWFDPLERDWTIRLTGGAFKPDIDSQFDSSTAPQELPYESFFGTEKGDVYYRY